MTGASSDDDRSDRLPASRRRLSAEDVAGPEWAAWYALTPDERWRRSMELWREYVALGGSLDPEVDSQSPFWSREDLEGFARRQHAVRRTVDGRASPDEIA